MCAATQQFYNGRLSINREKTSPYWMVTFEGADGKMYRRSTKVPVAGGLFEGVKISAKLAEKLAYQRGVQIACALKEEFESHNNVSVRSWFEGFISRRAGLLSVRTVNNAKTAYKYFFNFLGGRADAPLRLVSKADVKAWVDARRLQVRHRTVLKDLAAVSQAFNDAVDSDVITKNPCVGVVVPADRAGEKVVKEAFSLEEIRYMVEKFPPAWSSAVRCAFETYGQRLGDILKLDWRQFDWDARVVRFVTGKTGRVLAQPMRPGFFRWAHQRWAMSGCPASGLLHGELLALGDGASYQFGLLLRTHGIGLVNGCSDGRRRQMNSKSFHSIRATCATLLQGGGVAQGVAMELVGHESSDVHAIYIRPSHEQLMAAALQMGEL